MRGTLRVVNRTQVVADTRWFSDHPAISIICCISGGL